MPAARFRPEEIEEATGGRPVGAVPPGGFCAAVSIDSRSIGRGELFVALRGGRFDGHDFVAEALERGGAGALVERRPESLGQPGTGKPIWQVPDTLAALGQLARTHRDRFRLDLVAVTGSSGKTTTKAMLAHLLSADRPVLATAGTRNNRIGLPLTLLELEVHHRAAVLELGTNQWGEIRTLTEISRPTLGLITNVGPAHLQTFGDLRGVLRAKGELWEAMEPSAPVVLNRDDPLLREAGERLGRRVIWFSTEQTAGMSVSATRIEWDAWGSRCLVNGRWRLALRLPGWHNLMNGLAALTCAQLLGQKLPEAIERLQEVPNLPGRLTVAERDGILWMDDTYNANPSSLQAGLDVLDSVSRPGRKAVVLGDMLELGGRAGDLHERAGRRVAASRPDLLLVVGELAGRALAAALEGGLDPIAGRAFASPEQAGEFLLEWIRPGDTIFVKGSRAMRMERVLECCTTSSTR